jgi:hypothetical protein
MTLTTEEYAARMWFWAALGAAAMTWGLLVPLAWGMTHP